MANIGQHLHEYLTADENLQQACINALFQGFQIWFIAITLDKVLTLVLPVCVCVCKPKQQEMVKARLQQEMETPVMEMCQQLEKVSVSSPASYS